jgi:hypothetical protein
VAKKPSPVIIDRELFEADVERASDAGAEVAETARKRFDSDGVPSDDLRLCEDEGPEGAQLPHCLKVYLPDAAGRFGMVFQLDIVNQRGVLRYLAFGVRHHPADSHAETVYEIADRRLEADDP